MSTASASAGRSDVGFQLGRSFLGPLFDLLLIAGGLSLLVIGVLALSPSLRLATDMDMLMPLILAANSAHFAASTVRLYAMPDATAKWPLLTLAFPLAALAVLTLCVAQGDWLGVHFRALYLTWSPYHFAAQAYGISLMYAVRSGVGPGPLDRRLLRITCMLPFAYAFLAGGGIGLDWLLPQQIAGLAPVEVTRRVLIGVLRPMVLVAPLLLFLRTRRRGTALPLLSLVTLLSNGVWWTLLEPIQAFVWATIFHGIQYLAIVMIFHVKDRTALPGNRHGPAFHAGWFYAASLLLGYLLFCALPLAYVAVGFGRVESTIMVVAAVNLHHFVVDSFIWRFSKGGSNRRIVDGSAPMPA